MSQTMARRIADLNNILVNLKAVAITLHRHRDDLLISMATICKVEGFDVHVFPETVKGDGDMSVKWKRKDVKHHISKEERDELTFRVQQLEAMGFRKVRQENPDAFTIIYILKVK